VQITALHENIMADLDSREGILNFPSLSYRYEGHIVSGGEAKKPHQIADILLHYMPFFMMCVFVIFHHLLATELNGNRYHTYIDNYDTATSVVGKVADGVQNERFIARLREVLFNVLYFIRQLFSCVYRASFR
jgi:hypothetical protein